MDSVNEWHASADYPPLGTECEYKLHPFQGGWVIVKVVLYTDQMAILENASGEEFAVPKINPSRYFRPLNKEKNSLIKELINVIEGHKKTEDIAVLLIEKGWRPVVE